MKINLSIEISLVGKVRNSKRNTVNRGEVAFLVHDFNFSYIV